MDLTIQELTGIQLQQMIISGSIVLEQQREMVDALNVFPVPDGDTGTNMHLTVQSAAREVNSLQSPTVSQVAATASMGSLMGARGNSGVILSQLFRGFAKGLEGQAVATAQDIAYSLQQGVDTAYKAVMKPVEGTILTVARETAKEALRLAKRSSDIAEVLQGAIKEGEATLARTPEMLITLKQAGVVDAGGQGFLLILTGWLSSLTGENPVPLQLGNSSVTAKPEESPFEIKFQYCTEFIVKGSKMNQGQIRQDLNGWGDCLLVVGTEEVTKIHIHTNNPGRILEYGLKLGALHQVEIHNMREQSEAKLHAAKQENFERTEPAESNTKEVAQVAVVAGDGLIEIFRSLGVDEIVEGGQTMNPSTEELVAAINRAPAAKVFVLPNNGNVILAAEQAKSLVTKEVHVVPTRSVTQGMAAVLAYDPEASFAENCNNLDAGFQGMNSGEVTFAVRDSEYNGLAISKGDVLGLVDDNIVVSGSDPQQVALALTEKMAGADSDLVTVFYGQDVDEATAVKLTDELRLRFSRPEVEVHWGGQPLYYYIISVE